MLCTSSLTIYFSVYPNNVIMLRSNTFLSTTQNVNNRLNRMQYETNVYFVNIEQLWNAVVFFIIKLHGIISFRETTLKVKLSQTKSLMCFLFCEHFHFPAFIFIISFCDYFQIFSAIIFNRISFFLFMAMMYWRGYSRIIWLIASALKHLTWRNKKLTKNVVCRNCFHNTELRSLAYSKCFSHLVPSKILLCCRQNCNDINK